MKRKIVCSFCGHEILRKEDTIEYTCNGRSKNGCNFEIDCSNCAISSRNLCMECSKEFWDEFYHGDGGPMPGITCFNHERIKTKREKK
jgi:hypothetical protein